VFDRVQAVHARKRGDGGAQRAATVRRPMNGHPAVRTCGCAMSPVALHRKGATVATLLRLPGHEAGGGTTLPVQVSTGRPGRAFELGNVRPIRIDVPRTTIKSPGRTSEFYGDPSTRKNGDSL